ncbi:MAG: tRNA (adenosine(37)-N6)-threonylcarbamoyltransferase complex transferase subunit TsaD [Deltaproteobacteria bacterium]|nr:tRNA (adenosine(37)-N6)-threonylcarbamoyltransferase complex transferase subunit TsaD [Deltaproteobacteria bacterium]MBW1930308.1 tRNA (adenosine(37)-N6)-threonylcarbamoyltransferase complex transferase subunit TsaD [Deltaproteobacteria bacterium]MBW2025273.1 tRNA (adenosine(37)-N6)-threonylcarbamoyltransferase complex transferase subunit TsaD [Deltaproteobacteria bacterium]MBW2125288.1 tRNA (adenosine(37)-N6)-threonylcarbamoyltransferase complex transferase subunit TsaD [Deltaproteobacteria 
MYVLGIDTSCDDTSAAVVRDGHAVLSNVVHSQVSLHHPHGGVVPELASREHIKNILPVVKEALARARIAPHDLDGLAVTVGPGLIGSLLVGLYYTKALSYVTGLPYVAINHLEGHILSIFLEDNPPPFPFVCLTVSGGHTSLYHVLDFGSYRLLGQTLDDAAGEAFDKVAKLLGLGYPGGPVLDNMAKQGDPSKIAFPRAYLSKDSLDFSFSGLKTAVALFIKKWQSAGGATTPDITVNDLAASFQESVIDILIHKAMKAQEITGTTRICIAGGVACNSRLRAKFLQEATKRGISVMWPRPEYCTDNGAMIAVAGYHRLLKGERADYTIDVRSRYPIDEVVTERS